MEKGEFIYFMEKHVEYEFEAFKEIFERFDEDGRLAETIGGFKKGCLCPRVGLGICLCFYYSSWIYTTNLPTYQFS